ncbi:MAG: hypothetical protein ACOCXZ_00080 [Chloroflexota bacterium]
MIAGLLLRITLILFALSSALLLLVNGAAPTLGYGPQISYIVQSADAGYDLMLYDVGRSLTLPLTRHGRVYLLMGPVWSPDGRHVAYFEQVAAGESRLAVTTIGGQTRLLAEPVQLGSDPAWSSDSRRIAVVINSAVVLVDRVTMAPVPGFPRVPGRNPAWSPTGEYLAYFGGDLDEGVRALDPVSGQAGLLIDIEAVLREAGAAPFPVLPTLLAWSPDGGSVFIGSGAQFAVSPPGIIYDTRSARAQVIEPAWSADWSGTGRALVYVGREEQNAPLGVYRYDRDIGVVQWLAFGDSPSWSPDDRWILFRQPLAAGRAWALMRPDGRERRDVLPEDARRVSMLQGERGIFFLAWRPGS